MRIVCDPNPYCYGSIATLGAILKELRRARPDVEPVVLTCGPTEDLSAGFPSAQCQVKDPAALREQGDVLQTADLYVAVSNNTNIPFVIERGIPFVFVDILFWMKRRQTPAMSAAARYVIQNFPGVERTLASFQPKRPCVVGPIVDVIEPVTRGSTGTVSWLANIGGASSPDLEPGINTAFPQMVATMLERVAMRNGVHEMTLAMGRRAAATVSSGDRITIRSLSRVDYLQRLARTDLLLTTPGLNAPLEAFQAGIPVAWLPPQNLTQVLQMRAYELAGLGGGTSALDFLPALHIDPDGTEADGTAAVRAALQQLGPAGWRRAEDLVVQQIENGRRYRTERVAAQGAFLSMVGHDGARDAAAAVMDVLEAVA